MRTRTLPDGATSTASTWVTGKGQPSNQAVWLVSQVFGVKRSELWHLGETLWDIRQARNREERLRRARDEKDVEAMEELFDELDDAQVDYLLERLEQRKRERIAS